MKVSNPRSGSFSSNNPPVAVENPVREEDEEDDEHEAEEAKEEIDIDDDNGDNGGSSS